MHAELLAGLELIEVAPDAESYGEVSRRSAIAAGLADAL
jgi:hypothetical protein